MLVRFVDLLAEADAQGAAVGGFTAYNLETAVAVLDAAAQLGSRVMILISAQSFTSAGGPSLVRALSAVAARSLVPCCLQLDHVADLRTIEAALNAGVGAVMADGSRLSYEDNIELVRQAVELADRAGVGVEAELGRIEGDEDIATAAAAGKLTDPGRADAFLERTGAACLAVSIGNAHGRYVRAPILDLDRLEQIDSSVDAPLSLHGASGLPERQVVAAVQRGIRKINVNTELRDRYFDVIAQMTPELREGAQLLALQERLIEALSEVVGSKLRLFAVAGQPSWDRTEP